MTVALNDLDLALRQLLRPEQFNDYCPNGLQVEGNPRVTRVVTGVTACQALIEKTAEAGAELILVHHGYFWRGEDPAVRGMKRARLKALLDNDISLIAYHLPLDAHPEFGNNAQLGKLLEIEPTGDLGKINKNSIGLVGKLAEPVECSEFARTLREKLGREPLVIAGNERPVHTIAWCTGAAQGFIEQAIDAGVDAYLTGEVSEQTVHSAREAGIHFFSAGHHATERYGVQALGAFLKREFSIEHQFIDVDNPV
ncbi:MAG: Nif3-like dinuclear metal center hexameric protein [Pseudohongiellaceae bacterium]